MLDRRIGASLSPCAVQLIRSPRAVAVCGFRGGRAMRRSAGLATGPRAVLLEGVAAAEEPGQALLDRLAFMAKPLGVG